MKRIVTIILGLVLCLCLALPGFAEEEKNQIVISYPGTDVSVILSDAFFAGTRTWTSMELWSQPTESTWIIARPGCKVTFTHTTALIGYTLNGDSGTEYGMGISARYQPETYDIEYLFGELGWRDYDMLQIWPQVVIDTVGNCDSYCISMTYAVLSPQRLSVDGEYIDVEKYNINGNNYFKLRDIAYLLNGTPAQFSVFWDGSCMWITTGEAYEPNGMELDLGEDKSISARRSEQHVYINGELRTDLTVYYMKGNNFFKLRDLGDALGFEVDYDKATNSALINPD